MLNIILKYLNLTPQNFFEVVNEFSILWMLNNVEYNKYLNLTPQNFFEVVINLYVDCRHLNLKPNILLYLTLKITIS